MKVVVQMVKEASVSVNQQLVSEIGKGYCLLVGITTEDTQADLEKMAKKIVELRIQGDEQGKMNLSIQDVGGEILSISQFTLCADTRKGRRPSFTDAARPETAKPMFEQFNELLRSHGMTVKEGIFQAEMLVHIENDGPVTIILDTKEWA